MQKYAIFKDIFPGLSRSWNYQKKSRTFHKAWEPWPTVWGVKNTIYMDYMVQHNNLLNNNFTIVGLLHIKMFNW